MLQKICLDHTFRFRSLISKFLQLVYCNLKIYFSHHLFNLKIKTIICNSLVLSQLDFGDTIYEHCLDYEDKDSEIAKLLLDLQC